MTFDEYARRQSLQSRGSLSAANTRSSDRRPDLLNRLSVTILVLFISMAGPLADTLTVGPGGEHATIQAAVDNAIGRGGDHEIRIGEGTFVENVLLTAVVSELHLSGGWSDGFTARSNDSAGTVVSGGNVGRVFDMGAATGQIRLENLTIREGFHAESGAGVFADCTDCSLELVEVYLFENHIDDQESPQVGSRSHRRWVGG